MVFFFFFFKSIQFPSLKQSLNLKLGTMTTKMSLELTNVQL